MEHELRIGVIGFGSFALFACEHFVQVPGVRLAGIAGTHREAAFAAARRFGIAEPIEVEELLKKEDVNMVYIATPPFLHFPQALAALQAGKHVICEKPLAMTGEQAQQLVDLAREKDLCLVANLMQKYNPLVAQVAALIERRVLGEPLYARFENMASDEGLQPDHWFWDREKSGGIFIEHGVHFFDLFEGWFGRGDVLSAQRHRRPLGQEEHVQCSGRFGSTMVNFVHSFTQASRMDRQEIRIVFERGDIFLEEWVPTRLRVNCLTDDVTCRELTEIFPKATLDVDQWYHGDEQRVRARHKDFEATQRVTLARGSDDLKMHVYGRLLRNMLADQKAWIANHDNKRLVTDQNALRSVLLAEQATQLADRDEEVSV